ncbi:MAG: pyruvate ferredoxin oxidoreductase [archaeon]
MAKKVVISGSEAMAQAVKLCRPKVLPMFPITPSTIIPEKLTDYVSNGELNSKIIYVESEHSAISALFGVYATGVRGFTATASQGLALMHEILPIMAGTRFPAVMAVANRALAGPLNIWNDHSDSMSERDQGWIQLFCATNQEAFDTIIMAYKIAENEKVCLPVMVCVDGFYITHLYEPIQIEDQEKVDAFLPEYKPEHYLDTNKPKTFGPVAFPNVYMEFREAQEIAMQDALKIIPKVNTEFEKEFKRSYGDGLIETYELKNAKYALLTVGSITGTAKEVIDELKLAGKEVGLIRLKAIRPLPVEELRKITSKLKGLAVIDRHASIGFGGALTNDIKSALTGEKVKIEGFIAGLGGRDINKDHFKKALEIIMKGGKGEWIH